MNNELVKSTDITKMVATRNHIYKELDAIAERFKELNNAAKDSGFIHGQHYHSFINVQSGLKFYSIDSEIKEMKRNLDQQGWAALMEKAGLKTYMDSATISKFERELELNVPEFNLKNIEATFTELMNNKGTMFEEAVINLYKKLSWNYKTNNPARLGKKIIKSMGADYIGYYRIGYRHLDEINDIEKACCVIDDKPVPDYKCSVALKINSYLQQSGDNIYKENEYFDIKVFKKGTIHIIFKRLDIVEQMNKIIAKRYPGALAPVR